MCCWKGGVNEAISDPWKRPALLQKEISRDSAPKILDLNVHVHS